MLLLLQLALAWFLCIRAFLDSPALAASTPLWAAFVEHVLDT